jgi:hypothetical protein
MATAKIIAVRIRLRDWPPPVLLLIVPSLVVAPLSLLFNPCVQAGKALPVLWGVSA